MFLKKKGDSHWGGGQRKLRRKGQEATNIYIALEERLNHTKKNKLKKPLKVFYAENNSEKVNH